MDYIRFINEKYGHAEFDWGGAMEHQTCTSMGSFGPGIISHELAHQWYGDMITCKDWHHIWLNEGFATYSEAVYIEAKSGKAAYNSQIANEMTYARHARELFGFRILVVYGKFLIIIDLMQKVPVYCICSEELLAILLSLIL